jgi:hypothetical protein
VHRAFIIKHLPPPPHTHTQTLSSLYCCPPQVVAAAVCPERRRGFDGALSALASVTDVYVSNDLQVSGTLVQTNIWFVYVGGLPAASSNVQNTGSEGRELPAVSRKVQESGE